MPGYSGNNQWIIWGLAEYNITQSDKAVVYYQHITFILDHKINLDHLFSVNLSWSLRDTEQCLEQQWFGRKSRLRIFLFSVYAFIHILRNWWDQSKVSLGNSDNYTSCFAENAVALSWARKSLNVPLSYSLYLESFIPLITFNSLYQIYNLILWFVIRNFIFKYNLTWTNRQQMSPQ